MASDYHGPKPLSSVRDEHVVRAYLIKILSPSGVLLRLLAKSCKSNGAAIRAAIKRCRGGEIVEVWQDDICIYDERPRPMRLVWPVCSEHAGARE